MIDAELVADDFLDDALEGHIAGGLTETVVGTHITHFAGSTGTRSIDMDVVLVDGIFLVAGCTFGVEQ